MNNTVNYIARIKLLMDKKGMTYKELAQAIGKTENTIVNYFKQRSKIDVDTLIRIAEALGVSPDILLQPDNTEDMFIFNSGVVADAQIAIQHSGVQKANNGQVESSDVAVLEQKVKALSELISEKERLLAEKDKLIEEKDKVIKEKERLINEKESKIKMLERLLNTLEQDK